MNEFEKSIVAAMKSGSTKALEPVPADKKGDKLVMVLAVQVLMLIDIIERQSASAPAA